MSRQMTSYYLAWGITFFRLAGRIFVLSPAGMRFGGRTFLSAGDIAFQRRVFPSIPSGSRNLKGGDIRRLFADEGRFAGLSDHDATRVCLLMLVHHGFMGLQDDIVIPEGMLRLIEDLQSWSTFPWGSYIWAHTHRCLMSALEKRKNILKNPPRIWKYNIAGFIYAFRIWIFETLPRTGFFVTYIQTIPGALGWRRDIAFTCETCLTFLDLDDEERHPREITPTAEETATEWYQASWRFFDGVEERVAEEASTTTRRGRRSMMLSCLLRRRHEQGPRRITRPVRVTQHLRSLIAWLCWRSV